MALSVQSVLQKVDDTFTADRGTVTHSWAHPFLRVFVKSAHFDGLDDEQRENLFAQLIGVDEPTLAALAARSFVRWTLLGLSESVSEDHRGTSWLSLLDVKSIGRPPSSVSSADNPPRFLHFYGFKGGQGRSSVLAAVASSLANDGWKVLAIDFDAEAPSLDLIFGASTKDVAATVVGLRAGEKARPLGLGVSAKGGEVALLPFRPDAPTYDYDAAALAFELQNYPPVAETIAKHIATLSGTYDVVLIDHRTGLGPVVPVLTHVLAGPVAAFARLDGQSRHARRAFAGLWALAASSGWPGMLVSLGSPDEDVDAFKARTRGEAEDILQGLADAHGGSGDGEPRAADEFIDSWVVWPFDGLMARQANVSALGSHAARAIADIRRLFNLSGLKAPLLLKKSGASDEGNLIVTQALRKLQAPNSPYTLIIGRKGTGKTRLVRALAEAGLGTPLLVPSDFPQGLPGIRAGYLRLKPLMERYKQKPELFWYVLLIAALSGTTDAEQLVARATNVSTDPESIYQQLSDSAATVSERRTYLIDALESTFDHEETFPFVRGLFRALETIDATPELSTALQLRLFVRRDLVERGIQNLEQLEAGRRIDLIWDVQSIFNFALSRIASLPWYREQFPAAVSAIDRQLSTILEGQLAATECEQLMLEIFPRKLSYKNMATLTFLRTYFSDESAGETSFYPRVYLLFLERLAAVAQPKDQRIDGRAIVDAHEIASREFLNEVSQELANATTFDVPTLKRVIDQLNGKRTPFDVDELVASVAESPQLDAKQVRELFNVMRQLGIFEEYPKRPNQWRPGRLFKTALGMRFASGSSG
jgi:hypothetical protein